VQLASTAADGCKRPWLRMQARRGQ
jgi:hypothetical protein